MKTMQEKIEDLIRYELSFLLDNPSEMDNTVKFFSEGGFSKCTEDQINKWHEESFEVSE